MTHIVKTLQRLVRHHTGNVTIEFGFVILFMVTLAVGAYDFGNLGYQKIALTNAARAGAQYGVQDLVTAADVDGMEQAARNDAGDNSLDVEARRYCSCPGQGEVSCSVLCADDSFSYMYVEVTTEGQIELLFPYPYVTSPQTVASTNTMRVR